MFCPEPLAMGGVGKSVGERSLPASFLYRLPHPESQPPASTSKQAPNAHQAGNALAVVTMVTGPDAWTAAAWELPATAWQPGTRRPPPRLRAPGATALLSLLLVPSSEPGTQGLLGMSCLSGNPQAVLGQTGLVQIPVLPLRGSVT